MNRHTRAAGGAGASTSVITGEDRPFLLPPPKPRIYALLSKAIYQDDLLLDEGMVIPEMQSELYAKGWRLKKFISLPNDYRGGVWVHEENKQIVIAHRGSHNLTSWVTDIETVVNRRPGGFVGSVIDVLHDPLVLDYRSRGFRLSTTGHSLGGFLAQISVFWSHRREFEETYFPDMCAVVFDSPGAVDFMRVLSSNLVSEKASIILAHLNIHNFCAKPTLVSTYGSHIGSIWHLQGEEHAHFSFVLDHMLSSILPGFDLDTGLPSNFRQMTDWPQADYSAYGSFVSATEHTAAETIKLPFSILNSLYKGMKGWLGYARTDTWFDQLFRNEGQVAVFLRSTEEAGHRPALATLEEQLTLAITGHYTALTEENSMSRLDIHHFDEKTRRFMTELQHARHYPSDLDLGWNGLLERKFGREGCVLLNSFELQTFGEKQEVVLRVAAATHTIFDFQAQLMEMLHRTGVVSFAQFMNECIGQFKRDIDALKSLALAPATIEALIAEQNTKIAKLKEIQKAQETTSLESLFGTITASDRVTVIAEGKKATAAVVVADPEALAWMRYPIASGLELRDEARLHATGPGSTAALFVMRAREERGGGGSAALGARVATLTDASMGTGVVVSAAGGAGAAESVHRTVSSGATTSSVPKIEGLEYQEIPGDGHCLFHAVGLYVGQGQASLRNVVAAHIEHNLDEFRGIIEATNPGRTPEEYLEALRSGEEWADNLEIAVLMRILNRPIVVIGPDGNISNRSDLTGVAGEPIFVRYNGHDHYDAYLLAGEWHGRANEILASLTRLNEHSRAAASIVASGHGSIATGSLTIGSMTTVGPTISESPEGQRIKMMLYELGFRFKVIQACLTGLDSAAWDLARTYIPGYLELYTFLDLEQPTLNLTVMDVSLIDILKRHLEEVVVKKYITEKCYIQLGSAAYDYFVSKKVRVRSTPIMIKPLRTILSDGMGIRESVVDALLITLAGLQDHERIRDSILRVTPKLELEKAVASLSFRR